MFTSPGVRGVRGRLLLRGLHHLPVRLLPEEQQDKRGRKGQTRKPLSKVLRNFENLMQMMYKYKLKLKLSFSGQSSGQKEEEGAKEEAAAEPEPQGSLAD